MQVTKLRPNATDLQGTWTSSPGGTAFHTALSDDSDTSYIWREGSQPTSLAARLFLGDLTIPAGAKISSVMSWIRGQSMPAYPGSYVEVAQSVGGTVRADSASLPGTSILLYLMPSHTTTPSGGEWTVAAVNDLKQRFRVTSQQDGVRIMEAGVDVLWNERPAVAPFIVEAVAGVVSDTTRPTVDLGYSDPEGDAKEAHEVQVFRLADAPGSTPPSSGAVWDSGEVLSSGGDQRIEEHLADGDYRAFVRARQVWSGAGKHWSTWEFVDFTVDVPTPPAPTLDVLPDDSRSRVTLTLTDVAPGAGEIAAEEFIVEVSVDEGATWQQVLDTAGLAADGTVTVHCYEAHPNDVTLYRARGLAYVDGQEVVGPAGIPHGVILRPDAWRLIDPADPDRNVLLHYLPPFSQPRRRDQAVMQPLGSTVPIVAAEEVARAGGLQLKLEVDGWDEYRALEALFVGPPATLLVKSDALGQWWVHLGADFDPVMLNTGGYLAEPVWSLDLAAVVVARPEL